jgi:hypothetical protein
VAVTLPVAHLHDVSDRQRPCLAEEVELIAMARELIAMGGVAQDCSCSRGPSYTTFLLSTSPGDRKRRACQWIDHGRRPKTFGFPVNGGVDWEC